MHSSMSMVIICEDRKYMNAASQMSKTDTPVDLHQLSARVFIDHCREKFGWKNLSSDVIMDVGCGEEGFCARAILEFFPNVSSIIGIDCDPKVIRNFKLKAETKIQCVVADIEKWETLQYYEGRMAQVISTHAFHQLVDKEEALQNVYRLLKPGREAAFIFIIRSLIYEWLSELLKNPKWKEAYQRHHVEDMYKSGFGADKYREVVQKIGFQVIECKEEERVIPYPSDQACKDALYQMSLSNFNLPAELHEEFKDDCLRILLKLSARDAEGRPCYRSTELSLLLVKPIGGAGAGTKNLC